MSNRLLIASMLLSTIVAQVPGQVRAQAPGPAAMTVLSTGSLDAHVSRVLQTFEVPGLALAVVKDGQVVLAKGYGRRAIDGSDPVDAHTLFGIASNTKVFTATALGILVDEEELAWDAPVVRYLPWFQMWDPWVTRELTVRDLLVHRSGLGLGAGDLLWWPPSTYTRREVAQRLRHVRPVTSFRSAYAYNNVLYIVAGEVIEAVSGTSWETFAADRILARVGMSDSNVRHSAAAGGGNVAATHARVEGTVRRIPPFDSDVTNAAGGINASATDMAKWLQVLLNDGRLADGTPLVSPHTAREIMTVVTPLPLNTPPPELSAQRMNFRGYALGMNVHDYRGHRVLTHTGGLPGYVSKVTMLPDQKLGIAVLTNQESEEAFSALTWHLVDAYVGAPRTDWVEAYRTVAARNAAAVAEAAGKAMRARDTTSKPSLPLAGYAGTYTDDWYGDIVIEPRGAGLEIRFTKTPALAGTLEHWQHDTFVARWHDRALRADAFVSFALDPDGAIDQVKLRAVSSDTDFSYDFHDLLLRPKR